MKTIIILLAFFTFSLAAKCQASLDSITDFVSLGIGDMGIGITNYKEPHKPRLSVTFWSNNRIELEGDTLAIIKMLWDNLHEKDSLYSELYGFAHAGIQFLNYVPDYWKSKAHNPAWTKYYALMRKHGYVMSKKK